MELLLKLVEPFTRVDVLGWFAFYKQMSGMAGAVAIGGGVVLCLFGPGPLLRVAMLPPAAIAGVLAGPHVAQLLQYKTRHAALGGAAVLVALALLWPPAILFIAAGTAAGLLGGEVAGVQEYWAGFVVGFVLGGAVLMAAYRFMSIAIAGTVGGYFVVLGAVSFASYTKPGAMFAAQPSLLAGAMGFIACATLAWHLHYAPSPEEKQQHEQEKARKKEAERENRERMKRFEGYKKKAS